MMFIAEAFKSTILITTSVGVMMLFLEYLNVRTQGLWLRLVGSARWGQYLAAALLGATPGCMGAYVMVALYAHNQISLGALVAAMIATSGGEGLVMLAVFPQTAVILTLCMIVIGIAAAWITDRVFPKARMNPQRACTELNLHAEVQDRRFSLPRFIGQWRPPTKQRMILILSLLLLLAGLTGGKIGPSTWNWMRITLFLLNAAALLIIVTVPDHFLEEHLWNHILKKHLPGIFVWTFGTLLLLAGAEHWINIEQFISNNHLLMLVFAALIGIIPESGPHLLFVLLYAKGDLPLSILVVNSIVQDGHGMLPLLAISRMDFCKVKLINLGTGLLVGLALLLAGQ